MIKLFKITNLKNTVFSQESSLNYLFDQNIIFTEELSEADILVAHKMSPADFKNARSALLSWNIPIKPLLLWTHEPRFSPTAESYFVSPHGFIVYNMNLYTSDVYFSNFTIYGHLIKGFIEPCEKVKTASTPAVGLSTFIAKDDKKFIINGMNIDLTEKRQQLLIDGKRIGLVDIYGKYWPPGFTISQSRGPGWREIKQEILNNYQFNICIENTGYPYYCTEKIWDSIKWGCLPVYSSYNNKIYETFPQNSFIDTEEFTGNADLFDYIKRIPAVEYLDRMNACIGVFNKLAGKLKFPKEKQAALAAIANRVRDIYVLTSKQNKV